LAQGGEIRSVRVSQPDHHLRAVFDLSSSLEYSLFELSNPDRVVVDLRKASLASGFAEPPATGLLKGLRTGHHGKDGVRIVFDLSGSVQPKSFLLPPEHGSGYRLVVDLYKKADARAQVVKSAKAISAKPRDIVIAVDAGHGGVDPGATGRDGTREKVITLEVARDLKRLIDKQPGMRAVLTRTGDTFIPLKRRYEIARKAKADLFVSIHADAYSSSDARGSSVWMLSTRGASSEAARWLADRENRVDLVGGVSLDDKDNTLAAVLLDLSQSATLEASGAVAKRVLQSLAKIGPTHRGYVEKANFVVLRSPDVPSILVETAFITNPVEEKRLKNPSQRKRLASAILDGVNDYFRSTPPPGSWFALDAQKANRQLAARPTADANHDDTLADDAPVARAPRS
ncbi:MAG TPA: N-acetylmuramoyl-L-alanine amidase, partial [Rudaea sp.]|nr:N-acetylmuramoyl-L-alanine amidase [Rudaea sp.]